MKKVLLVATVQSHIAQFHKPLIDMLHENGYEVDVAAKDNLKEKNGLKIENADKIFDVCFSRSPLNKDNIKAYRQLKEIVKENNYDIIHCNTPMGGVIARLVGKKYRKNGMKIIYTAHGFHFFKGAPLKNWIIYYPIERYLLKYTDCLITMNQEDYRVAKEKFKAKKIEYTHGVGVRTDRFSKLVSEEEKAKLKRSLKIDKNDFVIIYVAELTPRKNHFMLLYCMKELIKKKENIKLLLAGNGPLEKEYKKFIKDNNLENNVQLLGYRLDVPQLMQISDICVSVSKQEGLPVNIMEAMITGLPVIATNCRGNVDLVKDKESGYIIEVNNQEQLKEKIEFLIKNKALIKQMGKQGQKIIELYKESNVIRELEKIYFKI